MFDAAKNFVIQNGVFIDVGGNAKFFAKKLLSTSSQGHRYSTDKSKSNARNLQQEKSQLISDYHQIRRGDIKIIECIDEPVQAESVCNDFVIQVLGENTTRAARIYRGKTGYNQLKMELEFLSKMWPHPNIPQVFGIYKSNDTVDWYSTEYVYDVRSTCPLFNHCNVLHFMSNMCWIISTPSNILTSI
ncbi:hypothetical protein BDQ17DRAFT_311878 [Cyathus striatus]|nr:hypothetical protein BDQ17DRAFT_311878 [Cyathus striatus]